MIVISIISATGRLKNKIDFSYSVSVTAGESIGDSGMIFSPTLQTLINGDIRTISYSGVGTFSKTIDNITNGEYYVMAYAYDNTLKSNVYSSNTRVYVSDAGFEISADSITIADGLLLSDGSEGINKVLVSDSSGLSKWKPIKSMFNYGHYVGELYGGGIVVDVWKEGDEEKVLIASLEDLKSTRGYYTTAGSKYANYWIFGSSSIAAIGASAQSLYDGRQNTKSILNFSNSIGITGSAAQVCVDYRGGGYDDWYLPSYYEINSVYNSAQIVNRILDDESLSFSRTGVSDFSTDPKFTVKSGYWTSTEDNTNNAYAMDTYLHSIPKAMTYAEGLIPNKIRAVRKESLYTSGGLCLSLDTTNVKSFSENNYINLGTSSRWVDLVNSGMTSSYSFNLSSYPTTSSGVTLVDILPTVSTISGPGVTYTGNFYRDPLASFIYDTWYLTNITNSSTATPRLYNNGGTSSFISKYFLVSNKDATLGFQTADVSSIVNTVGATLNVYISTKTDGYSTSYKLIKQISNTGTSVSNVNIPLYSYHGKTISIKITAPNASYTSVSSYVGPTLDEISIKGVSSGYQATGPVYFPEESGFLRFSGTGSNINLSNTFGSYIDFKAPIGTSTTVTVEMWARLNKEYQYRMFFGWSLYSVYTGANGALGFNTGNGDLFGISISKVQSLNIIENWVHYVFEMRSDVAYTNNKMYINGNEQSLTIQTGSELSTNRNFNGGIGRIGGWGYDTKYLFNGDISTFRVYNRSLTKDEIMKNYNSERGRYQILPSFMKNNLKMSFDAKYSYSGTGTTILELSGSHSNADIVTTSEYTSPTFSSSTTLYPGKYFSFNGVNTKIEYPAIPLIENMSWETWVRCVGTVSVQNMFMGQVLPYFSIETNKFLFSNYVGGLQVYLRSNTTIELDKWYHFVATAETVGGKTLSKIYINGVKSAESYFVGVQSKYPGEFLENYDYKFAIGDGQGTDRSLTPPWQGQDTIWYPFKGDVSQVRVYYKSLSYEEIKNNYNTSKYMYEDSYIDSSNFNSHEINGDKTFSIRQNLILDIDGVGNDKILRSDVNGKASWVDKSYLFTKPSNYRYIGELYGGGIIVGMWKYPSNVSNYLIMSLEDINSSATYSWSNILATASNATSEHNGSSNTNAIIIQSGHITSAAKVCDDYTGGGFTDWYLPSVTELNQGFNAAQIVDSVLGTDKLTGSYWTSTEIDKDQAYSYDFNNTTDKISSINVSSKVLTRGVTIDTSFVSGTYTLTTASGFNNVVYSIVIQSDGKIVVVGDFTNYKGTSANGIIRLNSNGSIDTSFVYGSGFDNSAQSIVIQSDGKILVMGFFTNYNGASANRIIRLNSNGSIDTSFVYGSGFNNSVLATAIQSDGKILVGGSFGIYNGTSVNKIIRLNSNGSVDTSFVTGTGFIGVGGYADVRSIAIQSDGKILVGGIFVSYNGTSANRIIRLNSNGSVDTSFVSGSGFNDLIQSIAIQSDGKILFAGHFTNYNGTGANRIIRLNSNGSVDTSFVYGSGFNGTVVSFNIQSDGKILIGGDFTNYNGTSANRIIRLNTDGSVDTSFVYGSGFDSSVVSINIQSDGKILFGGGFTNYNGTSANGIIRLNSIDIPNRFKIRPFRLAQVYDTIRRWREEWEPDFNPIWEGPYVWDETNWRFETSINIDINPIIRDTESTSTLGSITQTGTMSFTFSNTVTSNESIINTGICWATSSTTPTIANSFTYSQSGGPSTFLAKTPVIFGPNLGSTQLNHIIYFRAFVTTTNGTYYSSNGNYPNGTTYSTGANSYSTLPTTSYAYFHNISYRA